MELISQAAELPSPVVPWQFHRPGKSHQEEFGYPEWGDKPTMQFPKGMQLGNQHGDVASNTVVMWTDKVNEKTGKDYQAPIALPTAHITSYFLSIASINTYHHRAVGCGGRPGYRRGARCGRLQAQGQCDRNA